ncbi:GntR family transcriptional regulator [Bordetella ansorpii]|uniref:GntR family transcriptional regulator n=1 Tax=Bordetella ansorpii TaxID=288768 RepID=A0A157LJ58_9BORD|nr:GntR family transcriptional regulator [Bordetella ansorpii]SAH96319.1 GntR family transcriptional regulator [Bordetella ansorpii]
MPTLPPIERRSLVDATIAAIREQIGSRQWPVGERIPPEADLAGQFGVGRNTVREAVRVLSHSHMLEVRQGDGTYVRSAVDPAETLRGLSRASLLDHLEMQRMLETEAARFAARRATAQDIERLRAALAQRGEYRQAEDTPADALEAFLDRDAALHLAVADAAHNDALQALYHHFSAAVRSHNCAIMAVGDLPEPDLAAHACLVEAIAAHTPERAAACAHALLTPLIDLLRPGEAAEH